MNPPLSVFLSNEKALAVEFVENTWCMLFIGTEAGNVYIHGSKAMLLGLADTIRTVIEQPKVEPK